MRDKKEYCEIPGHGHAISLVTLQQQHGRGQCAIAQGVAGRTVPTT